MGATWRMVLTAVGALAVSAVLTASCASLQTRDAGFAENDKLKLDIKLNHNLVKPLDVKAHGSNTISERKVCTQTHINTGVCKPGRLGYPLNDAENGEYLGELTRDPVLILTDVASPGGSCVCYRNTCYCN